MTVKHLNQVELAKRWNISPRTLERWRFLKSGPCYLKIGWRVVYRVEDIEAFEEEVIRYTNIETQGSANQDNRPFR